MQKVGDRGNLELVEEVGEVRKNFLQTLSLTGLHHDFVGLAADLKGITVNDLPVIEDALREGLSGGLGTEISGETERSVYGQVGLDQVERSSDLLFLREHVSTTTIEGRVDTTHSTFRALDFDQVDGLHEAGLGSQGSSIEALSGGRDDLASTSVDGVGVEGNIVDVPSDTSAVFIAENTFLGSPSESGDNGVLDFVKVLDSLGDVDAKVRSGVLVRAEAPDFTGIGGVKVEFLSEDTGAGLEFLTTLNLTLIDSLSKSLREGRGSHVETIVLVRGLGQADLVGLGGDSFTVGHNRVGGDDLHTRTVLLLEIVQTDLQVQLTGSGDNVLTRLIEGTLNHRIRLGKTLKTFDQLGEIVGVLGLDGDTHDRRYGELHNTDVVSLVGVGDGTGLQQVLIDTNQTDGVTAGNILDRLDVTSHHQDGTLDVLDEKIGLLARNIVRAHDANLGSGADSSGEDTAEGVETALIGGGHHLGDVEHQRTSGVAVSDGLSAGIIHRSLVQVLNTILLGDNGGRKMVDNHVKESLRSGQPLPHDGLKEGLGVEVLLVRGELDAQRFNHLGVLVLLTVHDGVEQLVDGLQDELDETTLGSGDGSLGPLTGLRVEVVVTPQVLQHLVASLLLGILRGLALLGSLLHLRGVHVGELGESETPLMEA